MSFSGFPRGSFSINGDDVAARGPLPLIENWRELGPQLGLTPSPGKFIVHKLFVMMNSQIFSVQDNDLLVTGKFSLFVRKDLPISETLYDMQRYYPSELARSIFIDMNRSRLSEIVRSPYVPRSFGGLARVFHEKGKFNLKQALQVYSALAYRKLVRPTRPIPGTDWSVICIPEFLSGLVEVPTIESKLYTSLCVSEFFDGTRKSLEDDLEPDYFQMQFREDLGKAIETGLYDSVKKETDLRRLRPLTSFQYSHHVIDKNKVSDVRRSVISILKDYLKSRRDVDLLSPISVPGTLGGVEVNSEDLYGPSVWNHVEDWFPGPLWEQFSFEKPESTPDVFIRMKGIDGTLLPFEIPRADDLGFS
jgi:hypothetical protein